MQVLYIMRSEFLVISPICPAPHLPRLYPKGRIRCAVISMVLIVLSIVNARAQRVVYSPLIGNPAATRFEVIGKAGNFYWVQKSKKRGSRKKSIEPWINDKDISFEIYDGRMNLINVVHSSLSDSLLKEYFIAGNKYFDRLVLVKAGNKVTALINRYTENGEAAASGDTLYSFPGNMKSADFLLVRSQDKSKILLLAFETVHDSPPRLHAILYDKDWRPLFTTICKDRNISQPCVQYDFVNYPLENFSNGPIKLANSGEWLMLSPSGISNNYLVMHFYGVNSGFEYKEIPVPENTGIAEMNLSLDNQKQEAIAGILMNTRYRPVKKIVTARYQVSQCRLSFDTAFRLNTLAGNKTKDENLYQEYFMAVPGKGFMLLKEYGRAGMMTSSPYDTKDNTSAPETDVHIRNVSVHVNKNEYTRYDDFRGKRSTYDRGDLSLFYFPAAAEDSGWSGILNKHQVTELNSSYLSYFFMPVENKLVFIYNDLFNGNARYSSTTVLDEKGNPLNEGLVFWKANNNLVFQQARQIASNELAVPYERNNWQGFAIIRL